MVKGSSSRYIDGSLILTNHGRNIQRSINCLLFDCTIRRTGLVGFWATTFIVLYPVTIECRAVIICFFLEEEQKDGANAAEDCAPILQMLAWKLVKAYRDLLTNTHFHPCPLLMKPAQTGAKKLLAMRKKV